MEVRSAAYVGHVVHTRLRPRRHRLRYSVFSVLFDIDELAELDRRSWLFSHNRFNLLSLYDCDHGARDGKPLRQHVGELLRQHGIEAPGGQIQLLCYPRILGYVFNPLSVYFCRLGDGAMAAVIYEVSNTFGQRHSYVLPASDNGSDRLSQTCSKLLYVSPFNTPDGDYAFNLQLPGEAVTVGILYRDAEGPKLKAHFHGTRRAWSDRLLAGLLMRYPLMTLKVMVAIHWEALVLVAKGLRLVTRPAGNRFSHSGGKAVVAVSQTAPVLPHIKIGRSG